MINKQLQWTEIIDAKHAWFNLKLKEVWRYRDLVYMFVKRNFISSFKQTILGPLWFFISPILTTIVFVVIFGNIAKLSTDGIPQVLFYLSGITLWNYFSNCLTETSNVFKSNASIFGKVYFPRLVMPVTIILSNLMKFGVQFLLFLSIWGFYWYQGKISPNMWVMATPFLILLMAMFALGAGMIFSALTTKYRDLQMLLGFGVRLFMYATPVIYPFSLLTGVWRKMAVYNPLIGVFECFKYGWLGKGDFSAYTLGVSTFIIFVLLFIGAVVFNKVEKDFMDTV